MFLRAAETLRADSDEERAYLQEEFLRRGLALPSAPSGQLDKLAAEAQELVLDLLTQEEK